MTTVRLDAAVRNPYLPTPGLVLDFESISQTYDRFLDCFPTGEVFYAMKANSHCDVIDLVVQKHGGLEIASLHELQRSLQAGASGSQIICSNPIKNPLFLTKMYEAGVYAVVVDSTYEVEKVAKYMPGCRVYVRLAVDNTGSVLPLAGKFGVSGDEALMLFDMARDLGLEPIGLSFHVGSQCLNVQNWVNAIKACGDVSRQIVRRKLGRKRYDRRPAIEAGLIIAQVGERFDAVHFRHHNIHQDQIERLHRAYVQSLAAGSADGDLHPECAKKQLCNPPVLFVVIDAQHMTSLPYGIVSGIEC